MTEFMITGIGGAEFVQLTMRVATGFFFAASGYHKIFNAQRHQTLVATLKENGIPMIWFNQWWVPGVELAAGLALIAGFLTLPAALGLAVICMVACLTDGRKRVNGWQPLDKADLLDDYLYLPEVLYLWLLAMVMAAGPGRFSLDALIF